MNRGHCSALVGALLRTGYQVGFLKAWRKCSLLKNKQMESQFIYTGDIFLVTQETLQEKLKFE